MTVPISPQALWLVCATSDVMPIVGTWVEAWTREEAGAAAGLRPEEVRAVYSEHEVNEGKWRATIAKPEPRKPRRKRTPKGRTMSPLERDGLLCPECPAEPDGRVVTHGCMEHGVEVQARCEAHAKAWVEGREP